MIEALQDASNLNKPSSQEAGVRKNKTCLFHQTNSPSQNLQNYYFLQYSQEKVNRRSKVLFNKIGTI